MCVVRVILQMIWWGEPGTESLLVVVLIRETFISLQIGNKVLELEEKHILHNCENCENVTG